MSELPQWEYLEYSHFSRRLAETKTNEDLQKMLGEEDYKTAKLVTSHLRAIEKTTSMQSNSQRRAHSRNSLGLNYDNKSAIKNALEIYKYYPLKTKEGYDMELYKSR